MPLKSASGAGEIRRLELVFAIYTLSIIARCRPEVSARSAVESYAFRWRNKV